MGRGRNAKEIVKVNRSGDGDTVNLVPVSNEQIRDANYDPSEELYVKRTPKPSGEIELELLDEEEKKEAEESEED